MSLERWQRFDSALPPYSILIGQWETFQDERSSPQIPTEAAIARDWPCKWIWEENDPTHSSPGLMLGMLADIEATYAFRDPSKVRSFLLNNNEIMPLLLDAAKELESVFGSIHGAYLSLFIDPDDQEEQEELSLKIPTDLSPEGALDKLDQFDLQWWLKELPRAKGKIIIDVERA